MTGMDSEVRVCPFCGQRPGTGMFCDACGRNLAAVDRLHTRSEWESARPAAGDSGPGEDPAALAERCAAATAAFLTAMHTAGDPGARKLPTRELLSFGRIRHVRAWVLRNVHREPDDDPQRYEPGLVLTTEGRYHRLESEIRGWGQRDWPRFYDTAGADPVDTPAEARLIEELDAVLREHGVTAEPPLTAS
jgi:hypothetical protein